MIYKFVFKKQFSELSQILKKFTDPSLRWKPKTKGAKSKTNPTISKNCRIFYLISVLRESHQKAKKRHTFGTKS
jgi:hypothetical protein